MRTRFLLSPLAAAALLMAGCQSPAAPVGPEGSPADDATGGIDFSNQLPAPLSAELDVTFATIKGVPLKLDLYYPREVAAKNPLAVYVHSGGWYQGDKREIASGGYDDLRRALLERGIAVASVNYRFAPGFKFPAQIEDVRSAIRFLGDPEHRFALDPERIALVGVSSGGHLAALAGLMGPEETPQDQTSLAHRPKAVVSLSGVVDLEASANPGFREDFSRLAGMIASAAGVKAGETSPLLIQNSPVAMASADDPPIWLAHGDADTLVPLAQSQALDARLNAVGASSTLVTVRNGDHSFLLGADTILPTPTSLIDQITNFLAEHLKP